MRHSILRLAIVTNVLQGLAQRLPADDKAWQESEQKKLQGHWVQFRDEKTDGSPDLCWLELDFSGRQIHFVMRNKDKKETWSNSLELLSVAREGDVARLEVGTDGRKKADAYCDFLGDKLIVVCRILPRPFEGLSISGVYQRTEP